MKEQTPLHQPTEEEIAELVENLSYNGNNLISYVCLFLGNGEGFDGKYPKLSYFASHIREDYVPLFKIKEIAYARDLVQPSMRDMELQELNLLLKVVRASDIKQKNPRLFENFINAVEARITKLHKDIKAMYEYLEGMQADIEASRVTRE